MPHNRISLIPNLKLIDACVKPILLYGTEVWNIDLLLKNVNNLDHNMLRFLPENPHLKYLKVITGLNRAAVNVALLSETGRFPLGIYAIKTTIGFWHHIVNLKNTSLAKKAYNDIFKANIGMCNKLQSLFHSLNFHHVWNNQNTPSIKCLTKAMLNKLKEKYIKYWKTCLTEDNDNFMNKMQCYKDLKKRV